MILSIDKFLLTDHYYVPVFGSDDNSCQPFVGDPWSPHRNQKKFAPFLLTDKSPVMPSVVVRAYAGPMSPKKVTTFH